MNTVKDVLEKLGYSLPASDTYDQISVWTAWYKGYHNKFHDYLQYNGKTRIRRRRKSLKMAKKVCEDHANLNMNEKVQLAIDKPKIKAYIDDVLKQNDFRVQANRLVEIAFALGTGAFVEYSDGRGGAVIDYIRADMIYPLSYEGRKVSECAFGSIRSFGDRKMIYLNIHTLEPDGYVIYNKLIPAEDAGMAFVPADENGLLPGGVEPAVRTGSRTPRFQLIYPNIVNNIDLDSPLGISVYANSIDLLESVDITYDSYHNEFRLGKKRIIVNGAATKIVVNPETGETMPIFDDSDTEFYGLPEFEGNGNPIHEINMDLRADAHEKGLTRFLSLLSDKCGLGPDRYTFENGVVKTATEVISDKSELYQNLKKNELVLEDALKDMCQALAEIGGFRDTFGTTVNFDDSIIEDDTAKRTRIQLLVSQGKFPLWRYLCEYEGYSEKDAKAIATEAEGTGELITFEDDDAAAGDTGDVGTARQDIKESVGVTLNGAQVASLIGVVKSVKAGEISKASAVALITSSFGMSEEQANKLLAEDIVQTGV